MADGGKINGMFIDDKADGYVEFEDRDGHMFQTESEEAKILKKSGNKTTTHSHQPGSFINGKLYK